MTGLPIRSVLCPRSQNKKALLEEKLRERLPTSNKGVTLIELLVAIVMGAIIIAGIYKVFIAQSKAYTVQDQVIEVQQGIRSAMETLLRDIRMAGYDSTQTPSQLLTAIYPGMSGVVKSDAITVQYRINGVLNERWIYLEGTQLKEKLFVDSALDINYSPDGVVLLENVSGLTFTYGVDGRSGLPETQDGAIDDYNNDGVIDANDLMISAATVSGANLNPIAVRVTLTAGPSPVNPDVTQMVQPRTLTSAVTVRNLCLVKTN